MRILVLLTSLILLSFCVGEASANPMASATDTGQLTEVKGTVYKRGFADVNREVWCDPIPAATGDAVSDGMQVGTGSNSWTQCTWKHVTARAWENSVYMVSPKQKLVYLVGGELLFNLDKHRPDKKPYSIWTKYLHATVRGTTLVVQSTPDGSKVSVLEGTVDVTNRLDNSVITLTPGVVYEVKSKGGDEKPIAEMSNNDGVTDGAFAGRTPAMEHLALQGTLEAFAGKVDLLNNSPLNLSIVNLNPVVLFDSLTSTTIATLTSLDQILLHPLLSTAFDSPLGSLPLIKSEMPILKSELLKGPAGVTEVFRNLSIQQVPVLTAYSIGSDAIGKLREKEVSFRHWAPTGVVTWSTDALDGKAPLLSGAADKLRGGVADLSSARGALNSVLNRGGIVSVTQIPGMTTSAISNITRSAGLTSVTAGRGGGVAGGVVGGVGGVVSGTVSGASQTVGGTLGGVGGGLGGILGGGGLGGLLK